MRLYSNSMRYFLLTTSIVFLMSCAAIDENFLIQSDIEKEGNAQEILDIKQRLNGMLAHHTGQPLKVIEKDTDRDNFMTADTAKSFGLIDQVVEKRT